MLRFDPKVEFTSPTGRLSFPNLTTPRQFKGKGVFSYDTGLVLEGDALKFKVVTPEGYPFRGKQDEKPGLTLLEAIQAWLDLSVERSKLEPRPLPVVPLTEKDDQGNKIEVPGVHVVRFKVDAETETRKGQKWDRKPKLFTADGQPITGPITIGGGTLARVKFTVWLSKGGDKAGVKLQPTAVQIIRLVESAGSSFEAYDGPEVEDGGETFTGATAASNGVSTGGDF